ncbi:MAG: ParB/RepB/Spo0J family partition protein [Clostridiales bacterium]|nr:ParB/RepB/Spo0J family partition protein [Clostridiales bacterium]
MPFCLEPARIKQRTYRQISALDIRTITGGAGPRAERGDMDLLRRSIARLGLISPLLVRARGDGYELIAGARRLSACRALGLSRVECVIMPALDEECMLAALAENACRAEPRAQDVQALRRELQERHDYSSDDLDELVGAQGDYGEAGFRGLGVKRGFDYADQLRDCRLACEDKPVEGSNCDAQADFRDAGRKRSFDYANPRRDCRCASGNMPNAGSARTAEAAPSPAPSAPGAQPPRGIPADEDIAPRRRARGYIRDERLIVNALGDVADKLRGAGVDTHMDVEHAGNSLRVQVVFPGVCDQNHAEKSPSKGEHSVEFSDFTSDVRQNPRRKTENFPSDKCEHPLKISDIGRELEALQADRDCTNDKNRPGEIAYITRRRHDSDNGKSYVRISKGEHSDLDCEYASSDAMLAGADSQYLNRHIRANKCEHTDCDSQRTAGTAAAIKGNNLNSDNPGQNVRIAKGEHSISECERADSGAMFTETNDQYPDSHVRVHKGEHAKRKFECAGDCATAGEADSRVCTGACAAKAVNFQTDKPVLTALNADTPTENAPAPRPPEPKCIAAGAGDSPGAIVSGSTVRAADAHVSGSSSRPNDARISGSNPADARAPQSASPISAEEYVMQMFREEMSRGISGARAAYDGA